MKWLLLGAVLLVGCAENAGNEAYWTRINGPDPLKLTFAMKCEGGMQPCYAAASRLCRGEAWRFLDTSTSSQGKAAGANGLFGARSSTDGAALLQCDVIAPPVKPKPED